LAAVTEWDGISGGKPTIRILQFYEGCHKYLIFQVENCDMTENRGFRRVNKTISLSLHFAPLLDSNFGS
jgi:hypothetical protein